jgi:hypothetical protein
MLYSLYKGGLFLFKSTEPHDIYQGLGINGVGKNFLPGDYALINFIAVFFICIFRIEIAEKPIGKADFQFLGIEEIECVAYNGYEASQGAQEKNENARYYMVPDICVVVMGAEPSIKNQHYSKGECGKDH